MSDTLRLCLAGDVMTGRGIDQALARSCDPVLYEEWVRDAREYLRLAERVNGPIARPLTPQQLWGSALAEFDRRQADLRIVNLETAVTTASTPWPGKGVHYRMHPANVGVLTAARIDACVLANNHVLDWGHDGLRETLHTLRGAGIACAGAGPDHDAAWAPARLDAGDHSVLLFALGLQSSGVPAAWAATPRTSGIACRDEATPAVADEWLARIAAERRPGDIVIASLHWGGNWVRAVPPAQRAFAQRLIDSGLVDLVHGHSSHHPLPVEVHRGKLILHGCGDLINDYEGIGPHGGLRSDVGGLYFATLGAGSGRLEALDIVPLRLQRFSLCRADAAARAWIESQLAAAAHSFAAPLRRRTEGGWSLHWSAPR